MTAFPTLNPLPTFSVLDIVVFPVILTVDANDPTSIDALLEDDIIPEGADNHNRVCVSVTSSKPTFCDSRLKVMVYLARNASLTAIDRNFCSNCCESVTSISSWVPELVYFNLETISPTCTPKSDASLTVGGSSYSVLIKFGSTLLTFTIVVPFLISSMNVQLRLWDNPNEPYDE